MFSGRTNERNDREFFPCSIRWKHTFRHKVLGWLRGVTIAVLLMYISPTD